MGAATACGPPVAGADGRGVRLPSGGAGCQRGGAVIPLEDRGSETLSSGPAGRGWVRAALVFYAAMAGVALAIRSLLQGGSPWYADVEAATRGTRWLLDGSIGLAAGLFALAASHVLTRGTKAGEALARTLSEALGPLRPADCAALALASALGEEALFRGALQPNLGLVGASLVFGLVHFAPRRELRIWTVFAFAGGLGLGGLFEATGNLLAPVVAHAVLNGVNLVGLSREARRRGQGGAAAAAPTGSVARGDDVDLDEHAER